MVDINPANPLGYEFLADFYILKGQYAEARLALELARDMVLYSGGMTTPRCSKLIREVILKEAPGAGIRVVDLPGIFAGEYPARVSDKSLFLDYCHLTVEGIKLAMRHTARAITTILTGKEVPATKIRASNLYPDGETLAGAHFGAAIHNAHHGQSRETLHYHCKKAVEHSSKIKIPMTEFADFASRRASSNFCRTFAEIVVGGYLRQYEGGLSALLHPPNRKLLDIDLVDAIVESFGEERNVIGDKIARLRAGEHGIGNEPLDLLESFYCADHYGMSPGKPPAVLFSARTTESNFSFIVPEKIDWVDFTISCRTPGQQKPGQSIRIYTNGEKDTLTEIPMSRDWSSWSFSLSGDRLKAGTNRLSIHWPCSFRPLATAKPIDHYSLRKLVCPIFGEIFSFQAVARK